MFHKLKKVLDSNEKERRLEILVKISTLFWIKDPVLHKKEFDRTHGNCCFNHQIGIPKRKVPPFDEIELLDYEIEMIDSVAANKLYALNKARGIGATELFLRWILFLAIQNTIQGRKFLIITGIGGDLSKNYIRRMTDLCINIPYIKSKTQDRIFIDKSEIIAMAANPDAIRGYENVGVIFADEAAHWNLLDDDSVLEAIEPHRTKSDASIIIVSTPNGRRGFFAKIFHNPETSYYTDYKPWIVAKDYLIDEGEVEKIKKEDYYRYEQEYNCKFLTTKYSAFPEEVLAIAAQNSEVYQLYD